MSPRAATFWTLALGLFLVLFLALLWNTQARLERLEAFHAEETP